MRLEELLDPLSWEIFLSRYYLQMPLAIPTKVHDWCAWGQWRTLEHLLRQDEVDVIVSRLGARWSDERTPSPEQSRELLQQGFTICVRHAERHDAELASLAQDFHREFHAPVDIHLYCTPEQCAGLGWHYDIEEVFILQTQGIKEWELRKNTVNPWPLLETLPQDMRYEREIMPIMRCRLQPGDVLYIPAGYWHRTTAVDESISLAIGVRAATGIDLLDYLRERFITSLRWQQRLAPRSVESDDSPPISQRLHELTEDLGSQLKSERFWEDFRGWHANRAGQ